MEESGIDRRQRYLSLGALAVLFLAVAVVLAVALVGVGNDETGNADRDASSPNGVGNMGAAGAESLPDGWSATALSPAETLMTGIRPVSAIRVVPVSYTHLTLPT